MGAQVGVLRDGHLAQLAEPAALYRRPVDAGLAGFVGEAVLAPGRAENSTVQCALGRLFLGADTPDGPVEVMVRPEQIKIAMSPAPGSIPAEVSNVIFYGHDAVVRLALREGRKEVTARIFSQAVPPLGAQVWLTVEGEVMAYPAAGKATESA